MADREVSLLERTFRAALELPLQRPVAHVVDEEERPGAELHALVLVLVPTVIPAVSESVLTRLCERCGGHAKQGNGHPGGDVLAH